MARRQNRKQQVLEYLKKNLNKWIHNQELRDLSGLNDVPRTIRLLRQEGWRIEVDNAGSVRLTSLDKEAARGYRTTINQRIRYQVLERDHFVCQACGRGPGDGVKLHVDHIVPVDWGGTNDVANLQTLCENCNEGKKAITDSAPSKDLQEIMAKPTVEERIEALFDKMPNQDVPSSLIQLVSKGALDWQRALRRIRERTGKRIESLGSRVAYRYFKDT
ncbi:MAG: HNH endonuclease signature motif containing protein [Dehalococcoidia bacterium]|nr:HNH endonuclease signature motif containing protein [Dehalococcoidia bacterium]